MSHVSSAPSSSETSSSRTRVKVARIPKRCRCGDEIVEKISKSVPNPYRRYYRCKYAYDRNLMNDSHVFKWVDEALVNEVEQLDFQVRVLEEEVALLKVGRQIETNEITKMMVPFSVGCLLTVVLITWYF
ncbi:uncharacterized protein At4g04775-like [Arabidopsis lyrata subsp. lyrata]|uniref:uncharacterized protein At4g04775-like n=1 Tax=Arabidopsis lyrata subsp. lyrata TaxID=81972 RepID=UPI000A29CD7C|nr:uncharacterized protein At4g04775-like [Arabidopsis lyrata subsp. lyrata]|eukprot:XP_020890752.1 uncharacterized protein At4g04775-like [Arabidopsis lyrata subsp. lyrata]